MPALSSHPLPPLQFPERSRRERDAPAAREPEPISGTKATPQVRPLLAGRYTIDRYLDRGGSSQVYLGWDELCEDDIVIKVLTEEAARSSALRGHFLVGSRAALAVAHENVVRVLAVREPELGTPYMVMEALRGELLADRLEREPQLASRTALALATQAAAGLSALHGAGIVHCDIKPEILFLASVSEAEEKLKILDFGLAEVAGRSAASETFTIRGTPQYMAPEQVLGDPVDPRTDVYAVGVVLFRLLTGHLPFDLKLSTTLLRHQLCSTMPPPSWLCDELDPNLERIVLRATRKNPENRYQSAAEMQADLERVARGEALSFARDKTLVDVYEPRTAVAEKSAAMLSVP